MGEMADFYVDQMMDAYPSWGVPGVRSKVYGPPLKCKHCGCTNVYWQNAHGRYVMNDQHTLNTHVCAERTLQGFKDSK